MSGPVGTPAPRGGPDPRALVDLATDVAEAAGRLLLAAAAPAARHGALAHGATRKSSRTDLATAADRASEESITAALRAARPEDAILGEETGAHAGRSGLTWVVDPLDGTTNFLYDFASFAVSIAVADGAGTLAGVVHDPTRAETYAAVRGGGATLNGERLAVRGAPPLSEALVGTGFSYSAAHRATQARLLTVLLPRVRDIRRAGAAALDLCYVAAGRLDGYYEADLQPWDEAAGLLVATEAGAQSRALSLPGDHPAPLVVATPGLLGPLVDLLEEAAGRS